MTRQRKMGGVIPLTERLREDSHRIATLRFRSARIDMLRLGNDESAMVFRRDGANELLVPFCDPLDALGVYHRQGWEFEAIDEDYEWMGEMLEDFY